MSTTLLMEAFDTQMIDSGDADIPMYSANPGLEPWLSVEANMGDDGIDADTPSGQDIPNIEVEMEYHDDDITEYEMADDVELHRDAAGELLDIDVLDASRPASPHPHDHSNTDGIIAPVSVPLESAHSSLGSISLAMPAVLDVDLDDNEPPLADSTLNGEMVGGAETIHAGETALEGDTQNASSTSIDPIEEAPDSALAQLERASSPSNYLLNEVAGSSATAPRQLPSHDAEDRSSQPRGSSVPAPQGSDADGDEARAEEPLVHDSDISVVPLDQPPNFATLEQDEKREEPNVNAEEVPASDLDAGVDTSKIYSVEAHNVNEDEPGEGDPHEISEGVYIDPPPAVLLSVSTHPREIECCLFNQPSPTSGSQSPADTGPEIESLRLILDRRPTLYYEPLSTVFEALRHDDCLQDLPDLDSGELVLDAYDLQLMVSEDNIHVHDVTLHDLNVLHDGADLPGPLRLRLRVVFPRFIIRYHALRDQIARLDLTADGEDGPNEGDVDQHDEQGESAANPIIVTNVEDETKDSTQHLEQNHNISDTQNEAEEREYERNEEELDGNNSTLHQGHDHEDYVEEADQQDAGSSEDAEGEDDEGDYTDVLDADDVHGDADADEGGDYVDYADYVEDDDERFGEELPETSDNNGHSDDAVRRLVGDQSESTNELLEYREVVDSSDPLGDDEIETGDTHPSAGLASIAGNTRYELDSAGETHTTDPSATENEVRDRNNTAPGIHNEFDNDEDNADDFTWPEGAENQNAKAVESLSDVAFPESEEGEIPKFTRSVGSPAMNGDVINTTRTASPSPTKSTKRVHDELDLDDGEDLPDTYTPGSPDSKRLRTQ